MVTPTLPERLARIEDELEALDSRVDSRTTRLWCEVEAIKVQMQEFREWLQEIKPCRR